MKLKSIRFRLTAWYAGLLALLLLIFSVATYAGLERYLTSTLRESLTRRAKEIGPVVEDIRGNGDEQIAEIKNHFAPEADNGFLRISRPDGTVLFVSGPPKSRSFEPTNVPVAQPSWQNVEQSARVEPLRDGGRLLISNFRISPPDGGVLLMEIGATDRHVREVLNQLLLLFAFALPLASGVAIIGGYYLTRRAFGPIGEITRKAEGITSRNLTERLPVPETGDELEQLSISLNGMIERIERAFRYLNRFTADASHELRTPLALIRTTAELSLKRPRSESEYRNSLSTIVADVEATANIIDSLLYLARADDGSELLDKKVVNLVEIVRDANRRGRVMAEAKQIDISERIATGPLWIEGDAASLRRLFIIVIDNAVKFTPAGGKVAVALEPYNGSALFEVRDTGVGISESDLPHVFERFFRADKARKRQDGGVGLGLSIGKQIVESHGGTAEVESMLGKGSVFRVRLPLGPNGMSCAEGTNLPWLTSV
jgi:heavy metal sensor kinase